MTRQSRTAEIQQKTHSPSKRPRHRSLYSLVLDDNGLALRIRTHLRGRTMAKARGKVATEKYGSAVVRKKKLQSHAPGKPMFNFQLPSSVPNIIQILQRPLHCRQNTDSAKTYSGHGREAANWTHRKSFKTRKLDFKNSRRTSSGKSSNRLSRRRPQNQNEKTRKREKKTNYPETERVPFSDKFSELRKPDFRQDSRDRSSSLLAAPSPPIDTKLEAVVESLPSLEKATATRQRLGGKGGG
jgi:hypothetical protein